MRFDATYGKGQPTLPCLRTNIMRIRMEMNEIKILHYWKMQMP